MNRRPGQVRVTTEVAMCSFCGRPRTLRREEHQLGALVRTIVTCETCHRTLSSTMGMSEPAAAVSEPEPVEAAPKPKRAPEKPAAAKKSATPKKPAPAKKTAPAAKKPRAAAKAPARRNTTEK